MPFGFGDPLDAIRVGGRDQAISVKAFDHSWWERVTSKQLGVSAADPDGHKIGMNIATRRGLGLNWYPADPYKQTLVGIIDRYEFYDGAGAEADWNIFIKPDPTFDFLIEDTLSNADPESMHKCHTLQGYCMEAEITPDEHFYNNPYFNRNGSSNRVGSQIGVYGPWVMEEAHGWRPEIHPSEILWWRAVDQSGLSTWTVMVVQDDSNRFDRSGNFHGRIARAWSAVPRRAVVDVAIAVDPVKLKTVELHLIASRNMHVVDAAAAPKIQGTFGGQVVLDVLNRLATPGQLRTRLGALSSRRAGGSLHCFLRVEIEIGSDDRGGEGYAVLEVRETSG